MQFDPFVPRWLAAAVLAAAVGAGPAPAQSSSPQPAPWLVADSAGSSVTLELTVTPAGGEPSARIAGYREGGAQVVVPLGWTVRWTWQSVDSTTPHSLVLMVEREKIPTEGGSPAFPDAMTRMVTAGLPAGATDQGTFVADQPGWYWLLCGVPEHALAGEWIEFKVDSEAKVPGVKPR